MMYSRALLFQFASNTLKTSSRLSRIEARAASTSAAVNVSIPAVSEPSRKEPKDLFQEKNQKLEVGPKDSTSKNPKDTTIVLDTTRVPIKKGKANPFNTILLFVPQQEAWVIERMGKFHTVLHAGHHLLLPILDKIRYVQSLKEIIIEVPKLNVITSEGVNISVDSVVHVTVTDPYKASYGTEDPEFASVQVTQTVLSSELGKIPVHQLISQREALSERISTQINNNTAPWGVTCSHFSIRELRLPPDVQEALNQQLIIEKQKNIAKLESDAAVATEINRAEIKQQALMKFLEAQKNARLTDAEAEAAAILTLAEARAKELEIMAKSISSIGGREAASVRMAENFVTSVAKSRQRAGKDGSSSIPDIPRTISEALEMYDRVVQNVRSSPDRDEEYMSDREGSRNQRF